MRGILDATGVHTLDGYTSRITATVTLQSVAANRAIEISTNGGDSFFTPVYDQELPGLLVVVIMAPVDAIRIKGAEGDVWDLLL